MRSLYHRAVGYSYEAEEVFQYKGKIIRTKVVKHVPPDTTAMIFWLKNWRRLEWRDVNKHEVGKSGDFDNMSPDELRASILDDLRAMGFDLRTLELPAPRPAKLDDGGTRPA